MSSIVFLGNGALVESCISTAIANGLRVSCVFTETQSTIIFAKNENIKVYDNLTEFYSSLGSPSYLFSINNRHVVPEYILSKVRFLSVNYHNSLLPKYAGLNASSHALKNHETTHGITWHLMDPNIDNGDILIQKKIGIDMDDTAETLNIKCFNEAIESFSELVRKLKTIRPVKQCVSGRKYYGRNDNYFKESKSLKWSQNATDILDFIRACQVGAVENYFGLPYIILDNKYLIVKKACAIYEEHNLPTAKLVLINNTACVTCNDGYIKLLELENIFLNVVNINKKLTSIPSTTQEVLNYHYNINFDEEAYISEQIKLSGYKRSTSQFEFFETCHYESNNKFSIIETMSSVISRHHKASGENIFKLFIRIDLVERHIQNKSLGCFDYLHTTIDLSEHGDNLTLSDIILESIKKCIYFDKLFFARHRDIDTQIFMNGKSSFIINKYVYYDKSLLSVDNRKSTHPVIAKSKGIEKIRGNYCSFLEKLGHIFHAYPDKPAIINKKYCIKYSDLSEKVNHLSRILLAHGVKARESVTVALDCKVEFIVAILAIIKIGAYYIPLSTDHPIKRTADFFRVSKSRFFITELIYYEEFSQVIDDVIYINRNDLSIDTEFTITPQVVSQNDLIYTIFTSGTTGMPKGVKISHQNIASLFQQTDCHFNFSHNDNWLLFHSCSFDFSVWEMFGSLLHGGTLFVVDEEVKLSPKSFVQYLVTNKINILNITPSYFYQLAADLKNMLDTQLGELRWVIFGGEKLSLNELRPFIKNNKFTTNFVNMYGITEATIHATYYKIKPEDAFSNSSIIGEFFRDITCLLLDRNFIEVSKGCPGQILLSGPTIATGYLNDPNTTNENFVPIEHLGERKLFYKTGDLAIMNDDGVYEYIGRLDNIRKVRGYRVNTDEINTHIQANEHIENSVVTTILVNKHEHIIAFYQPTNTETIAHVDIINFLQDKIPSYMIPSRFIRVQELPLNMNGKIDLETLLNIYCDKKTSSTKEELNGLDLFLKTVKDVLNTTPIRESDDFFQLGGSSLDAIRLIHNYQEVCPQSCLNIVDIYKNRILFKIYESSFSKIRFIDTDKSLDTPPVELTKIQRAILFSSNVSVNSSAYNLGFVLVFPHNYHSEEIKSTLISLFNVFKIPKKIAYINNKLKIQNTINSKDIELIKSKDNPFKTIRDDFLQPCQVEINASTAKLFHCYKSKRHILYFKTHHAIADGESIILLIEGIQKNLSNNSYIANKDTLNLYPKQNVNNDVFADGIIKLASTTQHIFKLSRASSTKYFTHTIQSDTGCAIVSKCAECNIHLPSFFAALLSRLIFCETGLSPLFGFTSNTRRPGQEKTFGSFATLTPFFISDINNIYVNELLSNVNNIFIDALKSRDIEPGYISNKLQKYLGTNSATLFDIVFTYQDVSTRLNTQSKSIHYALLKPKLAKYAIQIEVTRLKGNKYLFECIDDSKVFSSTAELRNKISFCINQLLNCGYLDYSPINHKNHKNHTRAIAKPELLGEQKIDVNIYGDLKQIFCSYLKVDDFDDNTGFFDLGITSLDVMQITTRIEDQFRISLKPIKVFSSANFTNLYAYVISLHGGSLNGNS